MVGKVQHVVGTNPAYAHDLFEDLLDFEDKYFKEGYDAGVSDSTYAGLVEGKLFGIEKGYEKAYEIARLHGRALVWQNRLPSSDAKLASNEADKDSLEPSQVTTARSKPFVSTGLPAMSKNSRLAKHVESLLSSTDISSLPRENTDDAVTEFDERTSRAKTKAKVVSNILGEPLNVGVVANTGIEDSTGLNARH